MCVVKPLTDACLASELFWWVSEGPRKTHAAALTVQAKETPGLLLLSRGCWAVTGGGRMGEAAVLAVLYLLG